MNSYKIFISFAALFGLSAVAIGALGSHLFEDKLDLDALKQIETALKYQFHHVPALLAVGVLASLHRNNNSVTLCLSGLAFIFGILFFSGSLYALAITGNDLFGKFTPVGGISFMLGWLFLFLFCFRKSI